MQTPSKQPHSLDSVKHDPAYTLPTTPRSVLLIAAFLALTAMSAAAADRLSLLENQAQQAEMARNLKAAEALYKQVFDLASASEQHSTRAAEAAVKLAIIYVDQGKLDQADPYYGKAIALGKESKRSGKDITELLVSLQDLADSQLKYDEAHRAHIPFQKRLKFWGYALSAAENFFTPARVLAVMDNFFWLYWEHGDVRAAKTHAEKMLLLNQKLNRDPLAIALCLQRIAMCCEHLNETGKQAEAENAALAFLRRQSKGDEGAARRQMASGYATLRDARNTFKNIDMALAIDTKTHGERSNAVADDLSVKAEAALHMQTLEKAEPILRKVIALRHKLPQENHFALLRDMKNLEQLLQLSNRAKEAEQVRKEYKKLRGDEELLLPIMRDLGMPGK